MDSPRRCGRCISSNSLGTPMGPKGIRDKDRDSNVACSLSKSPHDLNGPKFQDNYYVKMLI